MLVFVCLCGDRGENLSEKRSLYLKTVVGGVKQVVVIDARSHLLGRLAAVVAKQLLWGYEVVSEMKEICWNRWNG